MKLWPHKSVISVDISITLGEVIASENFAASFAASYNTMDLQLI